MAQSLRITKVMNQNECVKWEIFDDDPTPSVLIAVVVGVDQDGFDAASATFTTLTGPEMEDLQESG